MSEPEGSRGYNSGDDFILEYGEHRFSFNEADFFGRTEQAARELGLINAPLDEDELKDLAEFVVHDEIGTPRSPLAEHIDDHHEILISDNRGEGNIIKWMRRVLFTGALLDKYLLEGSVDVEFDETTGNFRYFEPVSKANVELKPRPSWSEFAYEPGA